MGRTTKRRYDPQFKMRVALDVIRGDKTLSEVASENGIAPSLAAEWRDQLLSEGAADVFGKTKQERERGARGKPLPRSTTSCRGTSGSPPSSATSSAGLATSTATTRERSLAAAGGHAGVTRKRASEPLGVARSSTHYRHRGGSGTPSADDEHLMAEIDRIHLENPAYGARKIARQPSTGGERVTRHRATGLMRETNVRPCCPLPSLSRPSKASRRFPYLLGGKRMDFPDQVWSTDIAYVQIGGRHARLTAVIDWHGRCIVGWMIALA
ncbi:transposase [Olsenella sp. Marseille-P4559]|uniref:transposase n=1 Tax=Olsenella sp. Marseille-P4559 TaxID=2364795 RepID=UPI0010311898|nr:transposase [Olsenella sp. Marseille-P4559]